MIKKYIWKYCGKILFPHVYVTEFYIYEEFGLLYLCKKQWQKYLMPEKEVNKPVLSNNMGGCSFQKLLTLHHMQTLK